MKKIEEIIRKSQLECFDEFGHCDINNPHLDIIFKEGYLKGREAQQKEIERLKEELKGSLIVNKSISKENESYSKDLVSYGILHTQLKKQVDELKGIRIEHEITQENAHRLFLHLGSKIEDDTIVQKSARNFVSVWKASILTNNN